MIELRRVLATVSAAFTADNHYGLYVGNEDGSQLTLVGRNESGPAGSQGSYNWSYPETFEFDAPAGSHLFLVAWDSGLWQMAAGQFTVDGGQTIGTNAMAWEVMTSSHANPGDTGPLPDLGTLAAEIQAGSFQAPQAVAPPGTSPWGRIPGLSDSAQFIWPDTFAQTSASDGNYVIFRTTEPIDAPQDPPESAGATLTADNHYGLFVGSGDGERLAFIGRNEVGLAGNPGKYNWSLPETWNFTPQVDDHIYVVAWDVGGPQSWIGQFTLPDGSTLVSNSQDWEYVIGAGPNPGTLGAVPPAQELRTRIAAAGWRAIGAQAANGALPWRTIPGIGPNANFIWHDKFADGSASDAGYAIYRTKKPVADDRVVVTMEVPDGNADEVMEAKGVHRTGTLRLVRTGSLDQSLLVKVGIGGDATYSALAWDDYTLSNVVSGLTGYYVTIPAGLSSIELVVTPIQDGTDENTETVTVTVQPYAGYELGEPSTQSGTVEILDAPNISSSSINYRIDIDARKDLYARAYGVDADTQPLPPNGRDTLWTGEPYLFSITGLGGERTDGLAWNIEFTIESVSGGFDIDVLHDEGKGDSFPAEFDVVADERKSPWRVRFFVDANRDGVRSSSESAITGNFDKVEQNRKALWVLQLRDERETHVDYIYDDVFGVTDFFDALLARLEDVTFIRDKGANANAQYYFATDRIGVEDAESVPEGITTIIHESLHALDDAYNYNPGVWPGPGPALDAVEAVAWTAQHLLNPQGILRTLRQFESVLRSPDADATVLESLWGTVVNGFHLFSQANTVSRPLFGLWPWVGDRPLTLEDVEFTRQRVGLWFNMSGLMVQYQLRLNEAGLAVTLTSSVDVDGETREIPAVFLL
jgi:hypothetical protein